jgi:hypothetical protein
VTESPLKNNDAHGTNWSGSSWGSTPESTATAPSREKQTVRLCMSTITSTRAATARWCEPASRLPIPPRGLPGGWPTGGGSMTRRPSEGRTPTLILPSGVATPRQTPDPVAECVSLSVRKKRCSPLAISRSPRALSGSSRAVTWRVCLSLEEGKSPARSAGISSMRKCSCALQAEGRGLDGLGVRGAIPYFCFWNEGSTPASPQSASQPCVVVWCNFWSHQPQKTCLSTKLTRAEVMACT